jgi:hypothetical protein
MTGANALFTDINRPLQWEFEYLAEKVYKSGVHPVNFMNPSASVSIINRWVANITHNRIVQLVQEGRITRLLFSALCLFVVVYLFLYVAVVSLFWFFLCKPVGGNELQFLLTQQHENIVTTVCCV